MDNRLLRLAKQNLQELQKLDDKIRKLYLEPEQPHPVSPAPPPKREKKPPKQEGKVEINPEVIPAPIAFTLKVSEILHKDQKLRLVTKDFAGGKCSFDDWVDTFFEACATTYNGADYQSKVEDAVNILLEKGYTLDQDGGFLANMRGVAQD